MNWTIGRHLYFLPVLLLPFAALVLAEQHRVHTVIVNADGSFSPTELVIISGDTVRWQFNERTDTIIPVEPIRSGAAVSAAYKPYDPTDPHEFTGPMPRSPSGVFTLGPDGRGFVIEAIGTPNPSCEPAKAPIGAGNQYLCPTGEPYATMDWTWQNTNVTGVFIRLRWNEVQVLSWSAHYIYPG